MKTELIHKNPERAAEILRAGGLVAVPTETVYGLAGNGLDPNVIENIYAVKDRPAVKPISLMIPDLDTALYFCAEVPVQAEILARRFWPGPLTLILKAKELVPEILRAGGSTVGLRCPQQQDTLDLLRMLPFPLAVPSANPSGEESPVNAGQVLNYFDGRIDAVIDGGPCSVGQASTVLDMSLTPYRVLRKGSLSEEEIADELVSAMTVVGITGGSGSGKTTALEVLKDHGALVLDCDAVYHELLDQSETLKSDLAAAFPTALEEGKISRGILGGIVFRDPEALQTLNTLTHRHIGQEIRSRLRRFAMEGGRLAAIDAIELISSGVAADCDFTVAVLAEEETRVARIMARDGISREKALLRIRAQHPDSYFISHFDYVVHNNGDTASLSREMNSILEEERKHGTEYR